jgi:hypothetical protein
LPLDRPVANDPGPALDVNYNRCQDVPLRRRWLQSIRKLGLSSIRFRVHAAQVRLIVFGKDLGSAISLIVLPADAASAARASGPASANLCIQKAAEGCVTFVKELLERINIATGLFMIW